MGLNGNEGIHTTVFATQIQIFMGHHCPAPPMVMGLYHNSKSVYDYFIVH